MIRSSYCLEKVVSVKTIDDCIQTCCEDGTGELRNLLGRYKPLDPILDIRTTYFAYRSNYKTIVDFVERFIEILQEVEKLFTKHSSRAKEAALVRYQIMVVYVLSKGDTSKNTLEKARLDYDASERKRLEKLRLEEHEAEKDRLKEIAQDDQERKNRSKISRQEIDDLFPQVKKRIRTE